MTLARTACSETATSRTRSTPASWYQVEGAGLRRTKKSAATRGLARSHNRTLKHVFKSAAQAAWRCKPFKSWYAGLIAKGLRPELARVTMARKIAAVTLAVWKSGGASTPVK